MINVMQPSLGREELDRLEQVFESNWIGKGPLVKEFERSYADHLGSTADRVLSTNCCSEGLFSSMYICGIRVDGENHFVIAPVPGGGLTHAEARYLSPYGRVESRWEKTAGGVKYSITIPANCGAEILLPTGQSETVKAGAYEYEV